MRFIITFIAFLIGIRVAGFWGALAALIIMYVYYKRTNQPNQLDAQEQQLFLQALFQVMGHLSKAKGRVTQEDIHLAENIMQQMDLDAAGRRFAQTSFQEGKAADFPLNDTLRSLRHTFANSPDLLFLFLEIQTEVALNDNHLDEAEQQCLAQIAQGLNISPNDFARILQNAYDAQHFTSDRSDSNKTNNNSTTSSSEELTMAYRLLDVEESADRTTVKQAYRKMMNTYHPDKMAGKGLPPEMLNFAKEKTQQIHAAYTAICEARNWK